MTLSAKFSSWSFRRLDWKNTGLPRIGERGISDLQPCIIDTNLIKHDEA